jgi:hypothetical protein
MRKALLSFCLMTGALAANAQTPELSSWILNPANTPAQYWQVNGVPPNHTLTLVTLSSPANIQQVCYNTDTVWIQATGLASLMGPFWNPGTPTDQSYTWKFPRHPAAATTLTTVPYVFAVGSLVNGVPVYSNSNAASYKSSTNSNAPNGDGLWHADAWYNEGVSLDTAYGAHPQQQGAYHSHATPYDLYSNDSTIHSALVGFAFDGFPIYGPFGYSTATNSSSTTRRMKSSYRVRNITQRTTLPDGSASVPPGPNVSTQFPLKMYMEDYEYVSGLGDLDEHNGRYCVTPEYPNGTYAYFVATTNTGAPKYPYYLGTTYYGTPDQQDLSPTANIVIPGNTSCLLTGMSEQDQTGFELFPNPTMSQLTVKLGAADAGSYELSIIDVTGRTAVKSIITQELTQVELGSLQNGMYMVILRNITTGRRTTGRLIKN